MIQRMLAIWSLVPLPFLNPAFTSGISQFLYCWILAWRILSITLLASEMSATVQWFEYSLELPFFGIGMKTDLFQSCGHCWIFQICWHIECHTLTASSFRIWNSLGGIPSPPLALFVVMLPKANDFTHQNVCLYVRDHISMVIWVTKTFLYNSSGYSCHFSSASFSTVSFLSFFYTHLCMKCPLGISSFLMRSLVFPFILISSTFLHCWLKKAYLSLLAILWNSAFSWVYLSLLPCLSEHNYRTHNCVN